LSFSRFLVFLLCMSQATSKAAVKKNKTRLRTRTLPRAGEGWFLRGIHWRRQLIPDFNFVTVWVGGEEKRLAGAELTTLENLAASVLYLSGRRIDIGGSMRRKPK
jgi:hypothetical protein